MQKKAVCLVGKCGTKPFVFFDRNTEDAAAFKLSGHLHTEALKLEGAEIFNPGDKGKPMQNWINVPYQHKHKWAEFAFAAFEEALKQPIKSPTKRKDGRRN
jgi:hypothetical protein